MQEINFRTDLADERTKIFQKSNKEQDLDGIIVEQKKVDDKIDINTVKVTNENGSQKIQKKIGTYTTINIGDVNIIDSQELEKEKTIFAMELQKFIKGNGSILVVGLGNKNITADSIGSKVVENLNITRHILKYKPELLPSNTREISAISPGVLGTTGIETQEIIEGIISKIKVSAIIVIDAIETNDISRLLRTIQITDTGIAPGAGVNNKRKEISIETMQIPVIAIGVPTVVEAATIVANTLDILSNKFDEFGFIKDSSFRDKYELIKDVLEPSDFNLAVMPKEIDSLVDNIKEIICYGINKLTNWINTKYRKMQFYGQKTTNSDQ